MRDFGKCEEITTSPQIVLEEERSKIIFLNKSRQNVRRIRVDGCVLTEGVRCDYLIIPENGKEHFIELKGNNVAYAAKQIEESIRQISESPQLSEKYGFIISTRCPLLSSEIQALKLKFKKRYNSLLIIKNIQYQHSI